MNNYKYKGVLEKSIREKLFNLERLRMFRLRLNLAEKNRLQMVVLQENLCFVRE
ncbi:MAG: hypothetical protein LBQ13_02030 [Endomicrobium sp.]|nr:hypothetical protein [Endomicrobium sp.]